MHEFINVAKANMWNGFMCCPCVVCKNEKDYSCSRILHEHLFTLGFMPNYICWTKHGGRGVIMEEDEEEGDDDNMIIRGFVEYGGFDDTAMGEAEEEIAAEEEVAAEDEPTDDLGQAIRDAQRECKSEKGEDQVRAHARGSQEIAIPDLRRGAKKLGTTLKLLQ
jgi:hypothetical protein